MKTSEIEKWIRDHCFWCEGAQALISEGGCAALQRRMWPLDPVCNGVDCERKKSKDKPPSAAATRNMILKFWQHLIWEYMRLTESTMRELSKEAGLQEYAVSQILRGQIPGFHKARKLCRAMGVDLPLADLTYMREKK